MYAIVRTGGKQYRVQEGRTVTVERLPAEEGSTVELRDVLLIAEDGQVTIGTPVIEGARVLAHVDAHGRDKKIIVFKYKSKVRTRKKTGHRQNFTRLSVTEILRPGQEPKTLPKPKRARRRKAEEEGETPEAEAEVPIEAPEAEAAVEAPAVEAPVEAPKRRAAAPKEAPAAKPKVRRAAPKAEVEAPKPRARAKKPEASAEEKPKTPRRRLIRRKKETE